MSAGKNRRLSEELIQRIEALSNGIPIGDYLDTLFLLDDTNKERYFVHLLQRGKDNYEPYKAELAALEMTQRELVDTAMAESGRSFDDLLLDGLTQVCKEAITRARRTAYLAESGEKTPEQKTAEAYESLRQQGKKVTMTKLASEAGVNYYAAKRWVDENKVELG